MRISTYALTVIIYLLFSSLPNAFPQQRPLEIEWEKTFGGKSFDRAESIVLTPDGGYAIAGYTVSKGAGGYDFWILKLDANGNLLWDRTLGGSDWDVAKSIISTPDGGYAVVGYTESKGAGNRDFWLLKLDARGNLLWDETFGGSFGDEANSIISTPDGGYAVAGFTESKGAGGRDVWLLKLDAFGNLLWDKTFGGSLRDEANSIVSTPDGGYAVAGFTESKGAGNRDFWLLKLDARGNLLWDKTLGGSDWDMAKSIVSTPDGGYAVAGYTSSKGAGGYDIWVLKLDGGGNLLWDKTFGSSNLDAATSIVLTPDGSIAVAGITKSKGAGGSDIWVLKLDINGNLLRDKTYGGSNLDAATSIVLTPDSGIAVAGFTKSKGAGETDIWIMKLTENAIKNENIAVADDKTPPIISVF